jgi:hypothetical protein
MLSRTYFLISLVSHTYSDREILLSITIKISFKYVTHRFILFISNFIFPFSDPFHTGSRFHKYETSFSYRFVSIGIGLPYGIVSLPYPRPFLPAINSSHNQTICSFSCTNIFVAYLQSLIINFKIVHTINQITSINLFNFYKVKSDCHSLHMHFFSEDLLTHVLFQHIKIF